MVLRCVRLQALLPNSKPTYAGPETVPLPGEPALAPHPYFDAAEAEEGHRPASVAYRYRRFTLGKEEDLKLVVR